MTDQMGKKYDKIAKWWHEKHKDSNYGMDQIERGILYCENHRNALDVGCGSGGRIINKLIEEGFQVQGLDVSEEMLKIARTEHPDVSFLLSDICKWESEEKFDLIIAWDSIFHLPMEMQEPVVSKLCNHLDPGGILIYTFGDDYGDHESLSFQDGNGNQHGELNNDLFSYGTIGINENLRVISDNGCQCRHLEIDQYPEGHVYIIVQKAK